MDSVSRGTPVDLSTYLHWYGSTLPKIVKIAEGFYGNNNEDTLETDQIIVIYKIEKQKMLLGLDNYKREVCVPRNAKNKVLLLPPGSEEEYNSIQELFDVHQKPYFRVLEDIPSHEISSETTLILLGGRPVRNNFVKCELIGLHDSKEILLPIQLRGKFQPLLDPREYYLEEVLEQFQVPVNIRFVNQSQANTYPGAGLWSNSGNMCLTNETEIEMVFAALLDDQFPLYVFPRTLDIYVSCGFRFTANTSAKIKECKQCLGASEKSLKRLDRIIANSGFLSAFPVRRFDFESLQPPSVELIPKKTKTTSVKLEETTITKEPETERDRSQSECISESSSQDEGDYEDIDIEWNAVKSVDSADEPPPLPPKTLRQAKPPLIDSDVTLMQRLPTKRKPVAKPRKRVNAGTLQFHGDSNDEPVSLTSQTQDSCSSLDLTGRSLPSQSSSYAGIDDDEICPDLPPSRPHFQKDLKTSEEANAVSGDSDDEPVSPTSQTQDSSSGLDLTAESEPSQSNGSAGNDDDEVCPELPPRPHFLRALNTGEEENSASGEGPPPLPPRPVNSASAEGLAYLVVDVTDWQAIEERALYTDPINDGKRFVQGGICQLNDDKNAYVHMKSKDLELSGEFQKEASSDSDQDGTDIYEEVQRHAEWTSVEEKATKIMEDYAVYTDARDDGQVFRLNGAGHLNCPLDDEPTYIDMTRDKKKLDDLKIHHEVVDCTDSNATCPLNDGDNAELRDDGEGNEAKAATSFENESEVKEACNQDTEGPHGTLPKKKTEAIKKATNISGTQQRRVVTKTRNTATNQKDEGTIIISSPREDDFVDFKDIQQHFKLMNELRKVHARVADLEKQVATKDELGQMETRKQQLPAGKALQLGLDEDSKEAKSTAQDKMHNDLDSSTPFCEHSQRKVKLDKQDNSIGKTQPKQARLPSPPPKNVGTLKAKLDREGCPNDLHRQGEMVRFHTQDSDDNEDQTYQDMSIEVCRVSLPSKPLQNMGCRNSKRDQDDCFNTVPKQVQDKFYNSNSDDDDDYEECSDRHYINQEPKMSLKNFHEDEFAYCDMDDDPYQSVEVNRVSEKDDGDRLGAIFSNIVEVTKGERVSHYLQLDNPSEEEDSVYVNVEDEVSDLENLKENVLQIMKKRHKGKTTGEQESCNLHELPVPEITSA